jgi:Flp pilus assembly protein TadB
MNHETQPSSPGGGTDHGLRLRRLELEYGLAQTGLKGTLIGVLAVILMLTIMVTVSALTHVSILTGTDIVAIFGILLVAVVAYGAFVYRRLVRLFDKLEAGGIAQEHDPS